MRTYRRFGLLIFFIVAGVLIAQSQDTDQEKSLGEVARENRVHQSTPQMQNVTQLYRLLSAAKQAAAEQRWDDSARDLHTVIDLAQPCTNIGSLSSKAYTQLASNEYSQGHKDRALGIIDEKSEAFMRCRGADQSSEAAILQGRAIFERIVHDYKDAEADFLKLIAIQEKTKPLVDWYPGELLLLTSIYQEQERYKDIVAFLTPRVPYEGEGGPNRDVRWAGVWQSLGEAHQKLGQYQQAEKAYNTAIHITSPDASLLSDLESLYHVMGKEAEAQKIEEELKAMPSRAPQVKVYQPPQPGK